MLTRIEGRRQKRAIAKQIAADLKARLAFLALGGWVLSDALRKARQK